METIVGWHIEMEFLEDGDKTRADCVLRLPDGAVLRAHGRADRFPTDPAQQRVGEEIAAARALDDLRHQLLAKAGAEIEEATHKPAHLVS
ncbi:DUF1876 domain-containing protein [Streptomyces alkaliterrae]|uniref:DUF1876 domain-containing protein n=1 Tax=Streptomyces alkaliterrae TaxID=2213162 RepID=A0A5P0YQ17_9ACTN|nr:DUF1876 domain-containing protein [Streptomyces alkaliterrae]MBB1252928.1 DUF1876 domain-containing protein [Streptomyces alkaliterrae]MBB1258355.1 DUF1876 domain-containing protein [Streptomyces alkaliterrae]MQS02348.1 DUF1876 domain-containing protein [Streptomyces alkaliterrae]